MNVSVCLFIKKKKETLVCEGMFDAVKCIAEWAYCFFIILSLWSPLTFPTLCMHRSPVTEHFTSSPITLDRNV